MESNANLVANGEKTLTSQLNKLALASRSSTVPVKYVTSSHIWTIHHFSQCFEKEVNSLTSAPFLTHIDPTVRWQIDINFSKDWNYLNLYIKLIPFLMHICSASSSMRSEIRFSILNINNKETNTVKKEFQFYEVHQQQGVDSFISKSILLANSRELLPDDKLTIFCEVTVFKTSAVGESLEIDLPKCRLGDDLRVLYEHRKFSDVTIYAGGERKQFPAHKAILSARSPVFQAMFELDTKENKNNRVDIPEVDGEVMKQMLHFIYTGEVLNLKTVAYDLMIAADKYQLKRLKVLCEQELCLKLSTENVIKMVILADLHNLDHLKDQAIKLISISPAEVMKTPGWKTMMAKHPHTRTEYLRDVLQRLVANSSSK